MGASLEHVEHAPETHLGKLGPSILVAIQIPLYYQSPLFYGVR